MNTTNTTSSSFGEQSVEYYCYLVMVDRCLFDDPLATDWGVCLWAVTVCHKRFGYNVIEIISFEKNDARKNQEASV